MGFRRPILLRVIKDTSVAGERLAERFKLVENVEAYQLPLYQTYDRQLTSLFLKVGKTRNPLRTRSRVLTSPASSPYALF